MERQVALYGQEAKLVELPHVGFAGPQQQQLHGADTCKNELSLGQHVF